MRERNIPRVMSTQHPDNASIPSWAHGEVIQGDDEVHEAYVAFSEFGVDEVMWDSEGKDVDTHIVRKLLMRYADYFNKQIIGEDVYLTYRIPNPKIEGVERKIVVETLENIPVNYDVAERFYGKPVTPIFEVILPFTTSSTDLLSVIKYYEKAVAGKESIMLEDGITVKDWVGEIMPKRIEVIPLVEDKDSLLSIYDIVKSFIKTVNPTYQRVFIARSDPAMNYGMFSAVMLAKYALSELGRLEREQKLRVLPIIGVGSLPFRGNFNPVNYQNVIEEYPGVYTFTVQSAFKYDYNQCFVKSAISSIRHQNSSDFIIYDESELELIKKIVEKYSSNYQPIIEEMADMINKVASMLPPRRARKLHVGLFGYNRTTGKVILPRAITFVGTFYSIGLPPELIGISSLASLREEEWDFIMDTYKKFKQDIQQASSYVCLEAIETFQEMEKSPVFLRIRDDLDFVEKNMGIKLGSRDYDSKRHCLFSSLFAHSLRFRKFDEAKDYIREMAMSRHSIG